MSQLYERESTTSLEILIAVSHKVMKQLRVVPYAENVIDNVCANRSCIFCAVVPDILQVQIICTSEP